MNLLLLVFALIALATQKAFADEGPIPTDKSLAQRLASIELTDINNVAHTPFVKKSTKAVALIFVSTDCPIANSFQPALKEIHLQFESAGVECFMVYCSAKLQQDQVQKHIADFKIEMPAVLDAEQTIGKLAQAKVTPEVVVIDQQGQVRYRGLINNLYAGYGKKRQTATEHYLRDALSALVDGLPIDRPETKPLGCFIHYDTNVETSSSK
jgi:hypothetical protein